MVEMVTTALSMLEDVNLRGLILSKSGDNMHRLMYVVRFEPGLVWQFSEASFQKIELSPTVLASKETKM